MHQGTYYYANKDLRKFLYLYTHSPILVIAFSHPPGSIHSCPRSGPVSSSSDKECELYASPCGKTYLCKMFDQLADFQGYGYVPHKDDLLLSLVCNKFRTRVSEELVVCRSHDVMLSRPLRHVIHVENAASPGGCRRRRATGTVPEETKVRFPLSLQLLILLPICVH